MIPLPPPPLPALQLQALQPWVPAPAPLHCTQPLTGASLACWLPKLHRRLCSRCRSVSHSGAQHRFSSCRSDWHSVALRWWHSSSWPMKLGSIHIGLNAAGILHMLWVFRRSCRSMRHTALLLIHRRGACIPHRCDRQILVHSRCELIHPLAGLNFRRAQPQWCLEAVIPFCTGHTTAAPTPRLSGHLPLDRLTGHRHWQALSPEEGPMHCPSCSPRSIATDAETPAWISWGSHARVRMGSSRLFQQAWKRQHEEARRRAGHACRQRERPRCTSYRAWRGSQLACKARRQHHPSQVLQWALEVADSLPRLRARSV
mmetsp:Transcript_123496/g.224599  ORF Transcript_123496/g.224599 Transcript_123496/m.224599 type:complete len:315 (+) Transcript_123496:1-945(+)